MHVTEVKTKISQQGLCYSAIRHTFKHKGSKKQKANMDSSFNAINWLVRL